MANLTFNPGCRNSWHSHKAGQLLIVPHSTQLIVVRIIMGESHIR